MINEIQIVVSSNYLTNIRHLHIVRKRYTECCRKDPVLAFCGFILMGNMGKSMGSWNHSRWGCSGFYECTWGWRSLSPHPGHREWESWPRKSSNCGTGRSQGSGGGVNQYSTGWGGLSSAGPQKPHEGFELDPKGSKSEAREGYAF